MGAGGRRGQLVGTDVFYQAPLYPYFLGAIYATFGRDLTVVRMIQAIVGAAACTILGLAAARLFGRRVGLLAGLGLALYAPVIFFDGLIQKTVLDVFFVCLVLWISSRLVDRAAPMRTWLCLGLALGGLVLTRENALILWRSCSQGSDSGQASRRFLRRVLLPDPPTPTISLAHPVEPCGPERCSTAASAPRSRSWSSDRPAPCSR